MRVIYRQKSRDDLIRQFRYYLLTCSAPAVALRFRESVRSTINFLKEHPRAAPRCLLEAKALRGLRSWPVAEFPAIRIYFLLGDEHIDVVRILHGKQDVRSILEGTE